MKRIVLLILAAYSLTGLAQVSISGIVRQRDSREPLPGISVMVRNAEGKIRKYSSTDANGAFSLTVQTITGCRLDVSAMSYARQNIPLDSVSSPIEILLDPANFQLKEVSIKSERIREQGDTISYNVGSFAQTQDRSIGDVLKRMPGIDVNKSGKIQYQGTDINKFYIEGSDLLGGKYGIATNGINHEDVGAVEVMENHQPMQVLSGISFSDKAAINLKLKKRAKATWTFHGNAAAGYAWQPAEAIADGNLFAMAIMPAFQNITTLKVNNTGTDLTLQTNDLFSPGRGTDLRRYVGISLPDVPALSDKRTLFNRSAIVSTNNLWKLRNGEFKAQIDYAYNGVTADATDITTYFLNGGNRIINETRNASDRSHSIAAQFIYEVNRKTTFLNNTLKANVGWDNVRLDMTGSIPNVQSASMPEYYVSNRFKMIKRFHGKHLITFESNNEWESLPQTLTVTKLYEDMRQSVDDHAFYTREAVAYAFTLKGVTLSLEGGVKGYVRSMRSELTAIPEAIPGSFMNVLNTNYAIIYVAPKLEYWIKRVNLALNAPVSFAHYSFDKAIANRSELYFSPSLSFNWKPNNRFSTTLKGGCGRSPMHLDRIHPSLIMTDYRSFVGGIDDFYTSSSQNMSAHLAYKHSRKGVFANASVMQSWSHLPYTMIQQLYGDYIMYSYATAASHSRHFMGLCNVGKTIDPMRGSISINGSFSRNDSHIISDNELITSTGTSWSAGVKLNGTPIRWMSFDYRLNYSSSRLSMNSTKASWLGSINNEVLINLMPHSKWECHIGGEHYSNEIVPDRFKTVLLLDAKAVYKLNKRIELSATLTNLLDKRSYGYTTYNQLSSYESLRSLRGRELIISISVKK